MIDFHTHILPGVDDGSHSVEESIEILKMLKEQGVDTVVATPHFYADHDTVDSFLERRDAAYEKLKAVLPEDSPRIILGAEVCYYPGIGRLEGIKRLRIEGSKLLLMEMSMDRWTEYTVREIVELALRGQVTLAIAHMERYIGFQTDATLKRIYEAGIKIQLNASYFLSFASKRKAISMLKYGEAHMIGSDCHGATFRSPKIGDAFDLIVKKLGKDFLVEFNEYGESLLVK